MSAVPPLGSDFNDLARSRGLDAVRAQVAAAVAAVPPAEWPDPIIPGALRTPEIEPELLPGWAGAMARAVSEATQTPPALATMMTLAVLAAVLQRRFEVAPNGAGYTEPLSLWALGAAASGSRKSAVLGALLGLPVHWEKLLRDRMRPEISRVLSARAVAKKRIERLLQDSAKAKDAQAREAIRAEIQREEDDMPDELRAPRLFTGDITPERLQTLLVEHGERMAVFSDEAGIFLTLGGLYTGGAANIDVFLQAHAGTAMRVDRAGRAAHIDRPALSFGLLLQPGVLSDVANKPRFRDSGLLARFLYVVPASNVGKRDVRANKPIPPEVQAAYESGLMALLEGRTDPLAAPRRLGVSEAALEAWLDLAEDIERRQGEGGEYESISDWTSKLPGAVARVAALMELAEVGLRADEVSHGSMDRAIRLGRLLIPHAQAAFGLLGTDNVDMDAQAVLRWIRAGEFDEFKRSTAHRAMEGRFRSVDRLKACLERLEACDVVRPVKRRAEGGGAGRPSLVYLVNPKVF